MSKEPTQISPAILQAQFDLLLQTAKAIHACGADPTQEAVQALASVLISQVNVLGAMLTPQEAPANG